MPETNGTTGKSGKDGEAQKGEECPNRTEVGMAQLLAEPDMAFLLDLNVQELVAQTDTNPQYVIKAVPPYPVSQQVSLPSL